MNNQIKPLLLAFVFAFFGLHVYGQKFESKFNLTLPVDILDAQVAWADLDNDSLLDVVVIGKKMAGEIVLLTAKNNADTTFSWKAVKSTGYTNAVYQLIDYNLDNRMDVILSGVWNASPVTTAFLNNGDFTFQNPVQPIIPVAGKMFRFADLDQDGRRELLINQEENGVTFLNLYRQSGAGWVKKDSIEVELSALEVFDFDGDIDNDIFISGHNQDSIFTTVLYNDGAFKFHKVNLAKGFSGTASIGDLNQDGFFDIVLAGKSLGNPSVVVYHNLGKRFEEKLSLPALNDAHSFIGDMNSDGAVEINLLGTQIDAINLIRHPNGDYDTLQSTGLVHQQFGDADRDGDLDLMQLIISDSLRLVFLYNTTAEKNLAPGIPFNPRVAWIFNRLFLYWYKPGDDHTPVSSITYDLILEKATAPIMTGDFDLKNLRRLLVTNGNQGTKNFNLLRGVPNETIFFGIQSVDNAFHAGPYPNAVGICEGICEPGWPCTPQAVEYINLCENEELVLTASSSSLWFSFASGYVGTALDFETKAIATDTLFSFAPEAADICAAIKVYVLSVKTDLVKVTEKTQYVCAGTDLPMEVEEGWSTVEWSSSVKGFISNANAITYRVSTADTVRVRMSNAVGCTVQRNTILKISKPVVTLSGETFQILKGSEVQLQASGGVAYSWQPFASLNKKDIPDPIASPLLTTEYTVTVTDSIGCTASAKVLVLVEQTAFVPNLFTPNADGKNDELKVYGLGSVRDFTFTIYNREGSLVYETNDVSEVLSKGWDGSVKGIKQGSGVYYWKVKGEYVNGGSVLLNGKKTGSVVLIR
ncbi:MAG: VCBS repeat-containing protein [Cyclobacteriaceae bacterium]|nr:VCBS repeat-containing protein [Cyclobacteriaceae bacterium]